MSFFSHIADMAGDIFSRATGAKQSNDMAQAQFNSQMDESIQRRVADGLKAGINPLAAIGASTNVSPTIHSGGSNGTDPTSLLSMFGSAAKGLKNMFIKKQEDDIAYDNEAKQLDLEGKRLENRILRNRAQESEQNLASTSKTGSAKEVPNMEPKPNRLGDRPLFSIAYDLNDRPRLVVNQDVMEGDSDNAGYIASLKTAIANNQVDKITGQINSEQYRMMLDDMYYNMTGRHIQNLNELYFSPAEVAAAAANLARGI